MIGNKVIIRTIENYAPPFRSNVLSRLWKGQVLVYIKDIYKWIFALDSSRIRQTISDQMGAFEVG